MREGFNFKNYISRVNLSEVESTFEIVKKILISAFDR